LVTDIAKWGEFGMLPSHNARRTPDRAALIDEDGAFSYRELDEAAHAVANGLIEKGVKGGDGVAILARNHRLIASFSRALTEGLTANQTDAEFDAKLGSNIDEIYGASVT